MNPLGLDDGLVRRLRAAGGTIAWRPARPARGGRPRGTVRVARLGDDEATVEIREEPSGATVEVDAGPVGAVVLLVEADRRGLPATLASRNGRAGAPFPNGSIVAAWGAASVAADARPTVHDLVELARYALP